MSHYNVVNRGEFSVMVLAGCSGHLCQAVGYILPGKSKCGIPTWLRKVRTLCIFIFWWLQCNLSYEAVVNCWSLDICACVSAEFKRRIRHSDRNLFYS